MAKFQPARIAYNSFEANSGSDPNLAPLIYMHGVTVSKEHWGDIPQIVANATKRKAYAIDARNHGDSEWTDYYNFDVNADDIIHLMDTIGISKAILVGHSMGGMTAIRTALKWPDRVKKIVVEDMIVRKPSKLLESVVFLITLIRKAIEAVPADVDEDEAKKCIGQNILSSLPTEFLQQVMTKPDKLLDDIRFIQIRKDAKGRFSYQANMEVIERAMKDPNTLSSDPEGVFGGPACFIYGKLSPFLVGSDEHHIKQFFPNAVFEGIEDAAHGVHTDKPLEFTDALLKFLS